MLLRASMFAVLLGLMGVVPSAFAQQRGRTKEMPKQIQSSNKGNLVKTNANSHSHAAHGPHGGEIMEVGKEEYHVEVVVDESKKLLTVYLLDKDAKASVAIDAPFVAVNFMLQGKPTQVKLKPLPLEADPAGLASCFSVANNELFEALHAAKSDPKLALKIRDKSYYVKITHSHDHSGHDHADQSKSSSIQKR